jgi:hypothetical protein
VTLLPEGGDWPDRLASLTAALTGAD